MSGAALAYFWGDDSYALDAAVEAFRHDAERFPAGAPERWRVRAEAGDAGRTLGEGGATGTMFGAGPLAILSNAGQLVRKGTDRAALLAAIALIADGNGFVVSEETDSGKKEPPAKSLADAIRAAGGPALVPEAVPGSIWAFVDAVGARQRSRALELLERLFDETPEPVLLAVLPRPRG